MHMSDFESQLEEIKFKAVKIRKLSKCFGIREK